jgi:PKD repeat protein
LPLTVDDYDSLWHNSDFTVNLTPDASNAQTYFRINGGQVLSVSVNGQPGITSESSNNTLEYWSVDGLGNEESPHKTLPNIKLDKTAPTGSILINNGANYTKSASVTLTLTSADTLSGVYQVRFRNDGVWATEPWETPSATKTWTLSTGDGEKTVYYQIRDSAGSLTSYSGSITLDTTNPSANAGQNRTVYAGSTVTLDASNCVDSAGIVSYLWDFGDGTTGTGMTTNHTYANTGTYSAKLTVQDSAGNTASSTVAITVQANVIPEFPPVFALFSMLAVTLLAAMVRKKGLSHSEKRNFRLLA